MACASRDLISVVGAGVGMIELLLSSTVRMILSIPDGAIVGIRRMRNLTPWLRFGLLKFVSCALARLLFCSTTRSLEPLMRLVERQFVSTTRPSNPSLNTIQWPTSYG